MTKEEIKKQLDILDMSMQSITKEMPRLLAVIFIDAIGNIENRKVYEQACFEHGHLTCLIRLNGDIKIQLDKYCGDELEATFSFCKDYLDDALHLISVIKQRFIDAGVPKNIMHDLPIDEIWH